MKLSKIAAALSIAFVGVVSTQAMASTFVDTVNKNSTFAGATLIDLGLSAADNNPTFTQGLATFTDGTLYDANEGGVTARPVGSTGAFWSVGSSPAPQTGPGVLTFSTAVRYVGFLWGSPDSYNTVEFFNGGTLLGSYTGAVAPNPGNGDQSFSSYFNFYAEGPAVITSVKFTSTGNAFETDNFAYAVSSVPEPESYALMLAGSGLMGAIARRRKAKAA
jgi:hypothetical protein